MKPAVLVLALAVAASALPAAPAFAQRDGAEGRQRPGAGMSRDQRQRMRDDMREVYRERGAARPAESGARPERPRQLSPEEREKLRRDIQNANKDLRR